VGHQVLKYQILAPQAVQDPATSWELTVLAKFRQAWPLVQLAGEMLAEVFVEMLLALAGQDQISKAEFSDILPLAEWPGSHRMGVKWNPLLRFRM
jgi:hypothetical protein